jgi:hypothetical protein
MTHRSRECARLRALIGGMLEPTMGRSPIDSRRQAMRPAVVLTLLILCACAGAAEKVELAAEDQAQLEQLHDAAKLAFSEKHYEEALRSFEAAYVVAPLPELLYGVARCHEELGHLDEAIKAFRAFAALSQGELANADKHVEAMMRRRAAKERPVVDPGPPVAAPAARPVASPVVASPRRRVLTWTLLGVGIGAGVTLGLGLGLGLGLDRNERSPSFPAVQFR